MVVQLLNDLVAHRGLARGRAAAHACKGQQARTEGDAVSDRSDKRRGWRVPINV